MSLKWIIPALLVLPGLVSQAAYAANAKTPYANVNHKNDAGNDTGDAQVDKLNEMQLNQNYRGPTYPQGQTPVPQTAPLPPK
jgi:hypothetical protein